MRSRLGVTIITQSLQAMALASSTAKGKPFLGKVQMMLNHLGGTDLE